MSINHNPDLDSHSPDIQFDSADPTDDLGISQGVDPIVQDFGTAAIDVVFENIGGIDEYELSLSPGVTLLVGDNATNRTSILEGIGAAFGGTVGTLKTDADVGQVTLSVDNNEFETVFERRGDSIIRTHELPWDQTEQREAAITNFVVLNESNPVRRAVRTDSNLYDLIMSPVDTNEISWRINQLQSRRQEIKNQIEKIQSKQTQLTNLEERRHSLIEELSELEDEIESVQSEINSYELEREEAQAQDEKIDEYKSLQERKDELETELDRLQSRLEKSENQLDEYRTQLETKRTQLDELEVSIDLSAVDVTADTIPTDFDSLSDRLESLRTRRRNIDSIITTIENVLVANNELLKHNNIDIFRPESENITDELTEEIRCWTCGSVVPKNAIGSQTEELEHVVNDIEDEKSELTDEIEILETLKQDYEQQRTEREELQKEIKRLENDKIPKREDKIIELNNEIDHVDDQIADLETEINELADEIEEQDQDSEIDALLNAYQQLGQLQSKKDRKKSTLAEIEDQIEELESETETVAELETELETIKKGIEQLREEKDRIEEVVVEAFNDHMEEVLDLLEYENLERVWIESKKNGDETVFELHIVRESVSGSLYEDSIDNLSESEREVVSIVVAIAGYLAHDINEFIPILLLDSIEAIDATRIGRLIEYFETETEYLIAALLEEDAAVLPKHYTRKWPAGN